MLEAVLGGFDRLTARAVIERQLDLFETCWKAPPDFVDGHQHVQQFSGIRDALVQALSSRYGNPDRPLPYLRISRAPSGMADAKSRVIAALGATALETIAAYAGVTVAPALLGIYNFSGNEAHYRRLMEHWLHGAPAGAIIMCHPAQAAEAGDVIGAARAQEYSYLGGPDFPAAQARAGVQLVRGLGR
jgi:predicted glycoside hydrolase/deacetylase ChbG (UPF0249 family)